MPRRATQRQHGRYGRRICGLSLVEVLLALMIVCFGGIALLTLLSSTYSDTADISTLTALYVRLQEELAGRSTPSSDRPDQQLLGTLRQLYQVGDATNEMALEISEPDPYATMAPILVNRPADATNR